jgi:hypothetical protein
LDKESNGIKMSLSKELLSKHLNKIFIETGTQQGYGIDVALKCGFKKIYSIEIDVGVYHECSIKFKQEIKQGRVELLIGDSAFVLKDLLKNIKEPVTFWLDAHAAVGTVGNSMCPIFDELDSIYNHSIKNHTILIDDRRMFGIYWGTGINELEVRNKILTINPKYQIYLADGSEPNDIIVAYV